MNDVTQILTQLDAGDSCATEQLLPLVYHELRRLAAGKLLHERPGHTLQATALVHEAYVRLVDGQADLHWKSRGQFFAAAAEAMRRILIENARRKQQLKHGGDRQRVSLHEAGAVSTTPPAKLLELDEALEQLEQDDPMAADVFKLRYFAGQTVTEAGQSLGVSRSAAYRHWTYARARLQAQLAANS